MKNITESLAGRVAVFELSSFSQVELNDSTQDLFVPDIENLKNKEYYPLSVQKLYERIFNGGMPKVNTTNIEREKYYSDYINTYIERDIRELEQVGKLNEFSDFLVCMASRTAQELHYDDISKAIGISAPTAKTWVTILERSGIIYILRPCYNKTPNHPDKNFSVLQKFNLNIKPGLIICLSDELIPYNKNSWYCPVSLI